MTKLFEYYSGNMKMRNVNHCYLGVNILSYSAVFTKKINLSVLRHWCFPGKSMIFLEATTGGVLWNKLFLKNFATFILLKRDSKGKDTLWNFSFKAFHEIQFQGHFMKYFYFSIQHSEAVVQMWSVKKLLLEISQNSQ